MDKTHLMNRAIKLAKENVDCGGWPFSAIIEKDGNIIAEAANSVHISHDPSDHAEIAAIRRASSHLKSPNLSGCTMYVVGLPCPMCLTCIVLAKINKVIYAVSVDNKDKCLSKLPLTDDLYRLVSNNYGEKEVKYEHLDNFSQEGENLFLHWNSTI